MISFAICLPTCTRYDGHWKTSTGTIADAGRAGDRALSDCAGGRDYSGRSQRALSAALSAAGGGVYYGERGTGADAAMGLGARVERGISACLLQHLDLLEGTHRASAGAGSPELGFLSLPSAARGAGE